MELDSIRKVEAWDYAFTAYTIYCIRVGTVKESGKFFALGKKYELSYGALEQMHSKIKKEMSGKKVENLPPNAKHGTYCFCLTYKTDMDATKAAMKAYLAHLVKEFPESKSLPDFFYIGDDWVQQQRSFQVFHQAYAYTKKDTMKGDWLAPPIEPFNETEFVSVLLQAVARTEFLEELHQKVPDAPVGRAKLLAVADRALLGALDTVVSTGWPPVQSTINKAQKEISTLVESGQQKLLEEIKPMLEKVVHMVQSKLKKKEEKEERTETKKKTEIGDFISKWAFQKTVVGKKLFDEMGTVEARSAVKACGDNFEGHVQGYIKDKLSSASEALLGGEVASLEIVHDIVAKIAEQIVEVIKKYTDILPFVGGFVKIFDARLDLEKVLVDNREKGVETVNKEIDAASAKMWKILPDVGLQLFRDMDRLKERVRGEMRHIVGEAAIVPLTTCADHLYSHQMKALNSVRMKFIHALKSKLADGAALGNEDALKEAVRITFRDSTFEVFHGLSHDCWMALTGSLMESAIEQAMATFLEMVWPTIKDAGLDKLQEMIPEQLAKMGLQVDEIGKVIARAFIAKCLDVILTKIFIKIENLLFDQSQSI